MSVCQRPLLWGMDFITKWRLHERCCLSLRLCIFFQASQWNEGCPCLCQSNLFWQAQGDVWYYRAFSRREKEIRWHFWSTSYMPAKQTEALEAEQKLWLSWNVRHAVGVRDGECRKKWHLNTSNFTPHETVRHTSNPLSEYNCKNRRNDTNKIKKFDVIYTLRCSDETLAGFCSFLSLFNLSKHCWPWPERKWLKSH